jgi:hypothetical protein
MARERRTPENTPQAAANKLSEAPVDAATEAFPTRAEKEQAREPQGRAERTPFGGAQFRLKVDNRDPNYVYRWFNDDPDRIQRAKSAGYEMVDSEGGEASKSNAPNATGLGSAVSQLVGRTREGNAQRGYLMRQKREWYDADQRAKQSTVDDIDSQIHAGYRGNDKAAGELIVDKADVRHG